MILLWLLIIPVAAGVAAWSLDRWSRAASHWTTVLALLADAALLIYIGSHGPSPGSPWLLEFECPWIPPLGIGFHLAVDGLSLLLLALTVFLGLAAVLTSRTDIQERAGAFHLCLMLTLAGIMGVFMAVDLFLFYFLWELMLVPMYFIISIWGHENRASAAVKFFLFTQAGSLLMLVAMLTLYFVHGGQTGVYTFDYQQLLNTTVPEPLAFWVMLGFFAGFAVKLPVVGLHTWLPDAHTEAPTAGSVLLAGLLLKTGAYGLLRFALPLFPAQSARLAEAAMILGVVGILYGAFQAFGQVDAKRLIAYSSVSHLGFVLLGIYAGTPLALYGAIVIVLAHGLSTGGLFIVVGILQQRFHTRRMDAFSGLWSSMPRLGGVALFLALASLGLPGLANFVGEFLVLAGAYAVSPALAGFGALGFVLSAVYSLWLIYQIFQGPASSTAVPAVSGMGLGSPTQDSALGVPFQPMNHRQDADATGNHGQDAHATQDLRVREVVVFGLLIAGILWLGVYPQPVLNAAKPQVEALVESLADVKLEGPKPPSGEIQDPLHGEKRDNR